MLTTTKDLETAIWEAMEEYQGWTNRETWAVRLHLANTQAWADAATKAATWEGYRAGVLRGLDVVQREDQALVAALEREEAMERVARACMGAPAEPRGADQHMLADCLNVFLARVNWREIVDSFAEE